MDTTRLLVVGAGASGRTHIDRIQRTPGLALAGIADPAQHASIQGPDTVDGIAPAHRWQDWWQAAVRSKREGAPWSGPAAAVWNPVGSGGVSTLVSTQDIRKEFCRPYWHAAIAELTGRWAPPARAGPW